MTVHIKLNTPSEHVSTSARHVSAQESRQCREMSSSTSKTYCVFIKHHFNLLDGGEYVLSRLGLSFLQPTKMSVFFSPFCCRCTKLLVVRLLVFLCLYVNYLKRKVIKKWNAN